MAEKKITKREMFEKLLKLDEIKNNEVYTQFIEKQIELLNRKGSTTGERKLTDAQVQNEQLKADILALMDEIAKPISITYMVVKFADKYGTEEKPLTNQRVSQLVTQLRKSGEVKRTEESGKAVFSKGLDGKYWNEDGTPKEEE